MDERGKPVDITKMPKWAQDHIRMLERERYTAIRALREYCDSQTESPIWADEMESLGERKDGKRSLGTFLRRYFQGRRVNVTWAGVELSIILREGEIEMSWEGTTRNIGPVLFQPYAFQQVRLKAVKKD